MINLQVPISRFISYLFLIAITFQVGLVFGSRVVPIIIGVFFTILFIIFSTRKIYLSRPQSLMFYTLIFQSIIYGFNSFDFFDFIRVFNCAVLFLVTCVLFNKKSEQGKLLNFAFLISILFLSIELLYRLPSINIFYIYEAINSNLHVLKFGTPFFSDSNGIGIYALCMFILSVFINKKNVKCILTYRLMFLFFIFFSLSRSCIIAAIILLCIKYIYSNLNYLLKSFLLMVTIFSALSLLPLVLAILQEDNSSNDRVLVFIDLYHRFGNDGVFRMLFGYGEEVGKTYFNFEEGHYSHAFIPLVLGQSGLFGLLSFCMAFVYLALKGGSIFIYLFCIMIAGLIFLPPYFETVYFVLAIILSKEYIKEVKSE